MIANPDRARRGRRSAPRGRILRRTGKQFSGLLRRDCPRAGRVMADSQVPWGVDCNRRAGLEPRWRTKPRWYCRDRAADDPPPAQRRHVRRTRASTCDCGPAATQYTCRNQPPWAALIQRPHPVSSRQEPLQLGLRQFPTNPSGGRDGPAATGGFATPPAGSYARGVAAAVRRDGIRSARRRSVGCAASAETDDYVATRTARPADRDHSSARTSG